MIHPLWIMHRIKYCQFFTSFQRFKKLIETSKSGLRSSTYNAVHKNSNWMIDDVSMSICLLTTYLHYSLQLVVLMPFNPVIHAPRNKRTMMNFELREKKLRHIEMLAMSEGFTECLKNVCRCSCKLFMK